MRGGVKEILAIPLIELVIPQHFCSFRLFWGTGILKKFRAEVFSRFRLLTPNRGRHI
jgi:hypothetical protein